MRLNIWDVSGEELEDRVLPRYLFKSVDLFVFVFALDNIYSLNNLKNWFKLCDKQNSILIKTKSDIKRISTENLESFKNDIVKNDIVFLHEFETNYKNPSSIKAVFESIFENLFGTKIRSGSFVLHSQSKLSEGKQSLLSNKRGRTCC